MGEGANAVVVSGVASKEQLAGGWRRVSMGRPGGGWVAWWDQVGEFKEQLMRGQELSMERGCTSGGIKFGVVMYIS